MVGKNSGDIIRCFAIGTVHRKKIVPSPVFIFGLTAAAEFVSIARVVVYQQLQNATEPVMIPTDPAVSADLNLQKDESDTQTPATSGNSVSFEPAREIKSNSATGNAMIYFKNRGSSNHNIVLELQMTDTELIRTLGKTGRTSEEQEKLESAEDYSAHTQGVTIAQSGSIPPGHSLEYVTLQALPDGTVLPAGKYNAVVYICCFMIWVQMNEPCLIHRFRLY